MYSLLRKYPKWYISTYVGVLGALVFALILTMANQYGLILGFLRFNPSALFTFRMVGDLLITTLNTTTLLGTIQLVTVAVFGWWILTIYAIKKYQRNASHTMRPRKRDYAGSIIAIIGGGCASCGTSILVSILGATGSTFISTLPLHGTEFALLALGLMIVSTISAVQTLQTTAPAVCNI